MMYHRLCHVLAMEKRRHAGQMKIYSNSLRREKSARFASSLCRTMVQRRDIEYAAEKLYAVDAAMRLSWQTIEDFVHFADLLKLPKTNPLEG